MTQYPRTPARVTVWRPRPDPTSTAGEFFAAVTPNAVQIVGARVQFSIKKSLRKHPNPAEIRITNLTPETMAEFKPRPLRIALEAGHAGQLRQLFVGDVHYAQPYRQGPTVELRVQAKDGGRAYQWAQVDRSLAARTSLIDAVREVAAAMGLSLPVSVERHPGLRAAVVAHGLALVGRASDQMSLLLDPLGLGWSIQDGALQVLGPSDVRPGDAILIDEAAGMIGSPEWSPPTKAGAKPRVTVRVLLFPELAPGRTIEIRSEFVRGRYRIEDVTHTGDTFGPTWTTEAQGIPL